MTQFWETITNFFAVEGWPFTQVDNAPILRMNFQGENGKWNCYAQAEVGQGRFVFYSLCPVDAPEDKRMVMAEFLTHANYGLLVGNFEMDFTDGEIRFKTSLDVEDSNELTTTLIRPLVYVNVLTMDRYFPGIMKIIYSDLLPSEVIAQIEID